MNHLFLRAPAYLFLIGCNIVACSLQVPSESDVFGKSSLGGRASATFTSTNSGGLSTSTAGTSTTSGGTTSVGTVGGSSTGGNGGTSANASGGTAGGPPAGGRGGESSTFGGSVAAGGLVATGGNGGTSASPGGASSGGGGGGALGGAAGGGGLNVTGGAPTATGGSGDTTVGGGVGTGGVQAGGAPATGGAATGGAATGGAATGGAATGGAATGGAGSGGSPPQVILQYNFEQGSGTTAVDSTANHNDGTLTDVTWSLTGRNGGSVNYGAADSQIAIPSTLLGTSRSLTISAWVNLTVNTAENRLFYFGTSDNSSYLTLTFNNSVNGISVRFQPPAGTLQVLTTPTQLPLGVWKHITVSVSNVGAALYVDGKIVAQDYTLVMDPTTLGTPMTNFVGGSPTAGQSFQGLIDEFYVYNGILPLSDIRQLAWPKADYSMYHLDEGTGTSTVDSSDRAINGTLVGSATWVASPFGTGVRLTNNPAVTPAQQYVHLGNGLVADCGLNLTLSGWFNINSNTTDAPLLEFAKDTSDVVNITSYATAVAQSVFSFLFNNTGTLHVVRVRGYTGWTMGTWTHVAAVRSGTDGRPLALYQNGVKATSGSTNTAALFSSWGTTTLNALGRSSSDTVPGFDGSVDEVLVACRAYTDDEIKQLAYLPPN